MAVEEKTTTTITDYPNGFTGSRKVAAAILGAIVVLVFALLLIGIARFVRSRWQTPPPGGQTGRQVGSEEIGKGATPTPWPQNPRTNTNDYKQMPATGPREDALVAMVALLVLGAGTVVLSKKIA